MTLPLNLLGGFRLVIEPLWASALAYGKWADRLPDRCVGTPRRVTGVTITTRVRGDAMVAEAVTVD